ncbi:MAG: hypothetical protein ACRDO1_14125 [Nocardioidaceae bacterium]
MTTATRQDTTSGMLRGALVPTLVVGVVSAAVAGFLAGAEGVVGAVVGLALVVVFFGLGLYVLRRSARLDPAVVLLVALGLYAGKIIVIGGSLLLIDTTNVLAGRGSELALGLTAIVCTVTWTVGQVVGFTRARVPLYDLGDEVSS